MSYSSPAPNPLMQSWPMPGSPRPIAIVGCGGVVDDAHLPAYRKAGFPVAGVYDIDTARSTALAAKWGIGRVYDSLQEIASDSKVVYDVAVPPHRITDVLEVLPQGATVLVQKPMGRDLANAREIRALCRERQLTAAVNFQLRFCPMMLAIKDAVSQGLLGDLTEIEIRLNLRTPWEVFEFLKGAPRVEIQVHSIHYLDWIRSLLGEPEGVYARTLTDPRFPELASTRTSAILNYGETVRCSLSLNHNFPFGPKHTAAMVKVEGTKGAMVAKLGALTNYPHGEPDELEITTGSGEWTSIDLKGSWFPDAFIGTMASLQRFAAGEDSSLPTSVEDAYRTMALVEACYLSNAQGGTPVPD